MIGNVIKTVFSVILFIISGIFLIGTITTLSLGYEDGIGIVIFIFVVFTLVPLVFGIILLMSRKKEIVKKEIQQPEKPTIEEVENEEIDAKEQAVNEEQKMLLLQNKEQQINKIIKKHKNKLIDNFTVIDVETTGLSSETNEIIELGAIKIIDNEIVDTFQTLCKPNRKISKRITELTGIDNDMVSDAPKIKHIFEEFIEFIGDDIIIGHNISFDLRFVNNVYERYFKKTISNICFDTLYISRDILKNMKRHRLSDLIEYFNISDVDSHRSIGDCIATYRAYLGLKEMLITRNIQIN